MTRVEWVGKAKKLLNELLERKCVLPAHAPSHQIWFLVSSNTLSIYFPTIYSQVNPFLLYFIFFQIGSNNLKEPWFWVWIHVPYFLFTSLFFEFIEKEHSFFSLANIYTIRTQSRYVCTVDIQKVGPAKKCSPLCSAWFCVNQLKTICFRG